MASTLAPLFDGSSLEPKVIKLCNFINGEFVDPVEKTYLNSVNPATGKIYASIPCSSRSDVDRAVESAAVAFKTTWSRTTVEERSRLLLRVADIMQERLEEFAVAESRDQGKPIHLARTVDIPRSILNFRYYATFILHRTQRSSFLPNAHSFTYTTPVGVAGLISPWNLPLYLLTWKIAPALAAGNTCVCKPSEVTSMTAFLLCDVLNKAGIPKGVVNMIFGNGASAGAALVTHPKVSLVSFTGGTVTGGIIASLAAPLFKKLSLELGGKNATIVFDDVDLDRIMPTIVKSSFANQGEICLCGSRIFVHRSIYVKFKDAFVERVKSLRVGPPNESSTDIGAIVSEQHMEKILSYVDIAKGEHGSILTGGKRVRLEGEFSTGFFIAPTVIEGTPVHGRVMQEEIFGPVVTLTPFDTEDEVVEYANSVRYGLSCSLWTNNLSRANRVSKRVDVGTCWINCWMLRDLAMPFGGVKDSGIGREGGEYSMEFFTEIKTICIAD